MQQSLNHRNVLTEGEREKFGRGHVVRRRCEVCDPLCRVYSYLHIAFPEHALPLCSTRWRSIVKSETVTVR